jgi:uncharacterized membrane protein YsdA (DUF1294 family)
MILDNDNALISLVLYLLAISGIALALCARDKTNAQRGKQRIPERTLLALAALGGSPGLIVGMKLFRHKTRKSSFKLTLVVICTIQACLIHYLRL